MATELSASYKQMLLLLLLISCKLCFSSTRSRNCGDDGDANCEISPHHPDDDKEGTSYDVTSFGARGDGQTEDFKAFQSAWKEVCSSSSKPVLMVPPHKTFLVGPIKFAGPCSSRVTVKILGTILAPIDPHVWNDLAATWWVLFSNLPGGLSLEGGGVVNGNGHSWWELSCKSYHKQSCKSARPTAIKIIHSRDVQVSDITIVKAHGFHLDFLRCSNANATGITIRSPSTSPNTDGIHIQRSDHVAVSQSTISTGDDCISIGTGSSHISISKVICGPGHGISVGSLGKTHEPAYVDGVKVDNVIFKRTTNGVRIKTWQGGEGSGSDIVFENVVMQDVANPIIINQFYVDKKNKVDDVKVSKIVFRNIVRTSTTQDAIQLLCSEKSPCTNIHLENIRLTSQAGSPVKARCENAFGTTSGVIQPEGCFM